MIDLYTWTTPNGRKISILLEELGVDYTVHAVDLDQPRDDTFRAISPNDKIPAIVDRDTGMTLMESGAIMLYLGQKYGRFIPAGDEYWRMMEWLMWQMAGVGPMFGKAHSFLRGLKGKAPFAEDHFRSEARRLYGVLDTRLAGRDFVVGAGRGEYSIADMAIWPWISRFEWHQVDMTAFPEVQRWYGDLAARPAVQKGYAVPRDVGPIPIP